MKRRILSFLIILLAASVSSIMAQTITALELQDGNFITVTTRAVPPVNKIASANLAEAKQLVRINETAMKPEAGEKIVSFKMTIITKAGTKTFISENSMLTSEMQTVLKTLVSGDQIYFEYINMEYPDMTKRSLPSLAFEIQ